ncbi:hypothetical protein [Enterobacter cancerogenus]|uniref:hypothetical protein n=1 Tax=Enterobacter cancerogenus TaxID=69218 RepID=UPI001F3F5CCD|nr:hypothetical protein [Enterobacter cancerogenus]
MSTITRERLLKIQQWRETYGPGSNVVLPAEEAEELALIALAAQAVGPVYQWRERYVDSDLWDDCTKEQYEGFAKRPDVETRILYTAPPVPVVLPEAIKVAGAALDYIDALPPEVVASLPAMPGFDRDWAENVLAEAVPKKVGKCT